MKLLQLTRDYPPAASGIGDHVARVSKEISAAGDEVVVVCGTGPAPSEGIRPVIDRWDAPGMQAIIDAVRAEAPDAIVWHYNPFQIGRKGIAPFAGRLAKALSAVAPLTVVFHELWYPWGRNGLRGLLWAIAQRRQVPGIVDAASKIILTTQARGDDLARRFPARARDISVIAAGATIEPSDTHTSRNCYGVPDGAFTIAHIGAIGEGRDLTPALKALDNLFQEGIDARLLLIGRTGIAPPAHPRVHVTGPLGNTQALSAAIQCADAYLFAEPTGPVSRKTSLLSALAHGLPVVSYTGKAAEPQFRDGDNLLLVEPSEEAVTAAFRRLAADPKLRARIGAGGKALSDDRYSWRAIAAGILAAAKAQVTV